MTSIPKRRGPKPGATPPLTQAERAQRYRERRGLQSVALPAETLAVIDTLAARWGGLSRAATVDRMGREALSDGA